MKHPMPQIPGRKPCVDEVLQKQRKCLPVYRVRKRLMKEVDKNPSLIVIGETGSGKTTQIPQLIVDFGLAENGIVGVTQPRRVAAITVAQRVAMEAGCDLGSKVGFSVRFEDSTSSSTRIKYLTDGMLLREAINDPLLKAYSFIILDEAHERTIHTDVLFGIVKAAQLKRSSSLFKPLKLIVMSATMDVDHFSKYLGGAPTIYLEGRQYPVNVYHAATSQEDYNAATLNTIFKIHNEAPLTYDMLVFLTGQEEIEAMHTSIRFIIKDPLYNGLQMKVKTLYAALSPQKQLEVFQPSNGAQRKVVLATNIAETSITLPGVRYVIDCGKVKSRWYEPVTGMEILKVGTISQAQAWQRTGRAGRDAPGWSYRAYTKEEFEKMEKMSRPEILRCNLSSVILQLLALKINASRFDFMDKPSKESIEEGVRLLTMLGAVQVSDPDSDPSLTKLGETMVKFPLDPRFSKILIDSAVKNNAVEEIVTIIAMLTVESIHLNNVVKREEATLARAKFSSNYGDLVTLVNVYRAYSRAPNKHMWYYENFINQRNMEYAAKVRSQLIEICSKVGINLTSCQSDWDKIRKTMLSGLFMNIAHLQSDKKYTIISSGETVWIHPTSVLHGTLPPLIMFTDLVKTTRSYIRNCTPIDSDWLADSVPDKFRSRTIHISSHSRS